MEQANAKRRRENQPSSRRWEQDHHNHSGGYGQTRWHGNYRSPQRRAPLVYSLARLVIRQEEEIKLLQQDTSMVLWLNSGGGSILHHLYTTAVEFKKKQQSEPTWGLHASQASHGTVHVPGVARPPPEGHQQSIASEQSQGDGLERRCRLAVSGLEPETEGTGARQNQEPGAGARDVQQAGTLCGAHQTGCGTSLSLHATPDGNHGGEKDFQAAPVSPKQARRGGLGSAGGASGLLCFPTYWSGVSSRAFGARADGTENPGDDSLLRRRFATCMFLGRGRTTWGQTRRAFSFSRMLGTTYMISVSSWVTCSREPALPPTGAMASKMPCGRSGGSALYGSGARDSDPDAQYTLQASRSDTQVTCSSHAGCMAPRS